MAQPAETARGGEAAITTAIINYNTRNLLVACLRSVIAGSQGPVLVVDSASTDDSVATVRREFPSVTVRVLPENRGFGAAANAAVRHCTTPYVLLLNSDTVVSPGTAAALADYLDGRPQVAIAGPRLLNPDGSLQPSAHPVPTPFRELMRWTSLGVLASRLPFTRERYLPRWSHSEARPVGWLVGAALGIRRRAFEEAGGFDESFFMYSEEVDLMYRLHRAGWRIHFAPVADVVHVGGASTAGQRSQMQAELFRSLVSFYSRHFPGWKVLMLRVFISYIMLRNLLRDGWRLRTSRGLPNRRLLQEDVTAWRRVLTGVWE